MENSKNSVNSALVVSSYLISVTFTMVFIYGLLFYNRSMSGQSTASWSIIFSSFLFPGALTNIFVGVLSDTYSKRSLMIKAETLAAIATVIFLFLFSFGFNGTLSISLYAATLSVLFSFFEVPLDASMVNVAGAGANKLVSIIWLSRAVAWFIGPILGRILSSAPLTLFYLNIASFVISSILQYLTSYSENLSTKSDFSVAKALANTGNDLKELAKYMKTNRIIGFLLTLNLIIAIVYMPVFSAVIPDLARELSISETNLSYIESASWLGTAIAAAIVSASTISSFLLKNLFNTLKIQSTIFFVWLLPLFTNMSSEAIALFYISLVALDGAINTFQTLGALTYFQVQIPEDIRGKLLGTMRTVMKITAPFGIFIYGVALEYLPWYTMMIVTAVVMIGTSFILGNSNTFKDFKKSIN